jgi:osmotically-inducible protein OsmY
MKALEVMQRQVVTVTAEASIDEAVRQVDTQPVADAEIRHRVIASLREQRWMPRTSFDVRVQSGVVELVGLVTDEREREAVRVLAENTPGVGEVVDRFVAISLMAGVPLDLPAGSPRE